MDRSLITAVELPVLEKKRQQKRQQKHQQRAPGEQLFVRQEAEKKKTLLL